MLLQSVAQLGKEPRIPEPEVVQVSLASIQALPDPREDLSRIVALDDIREFLWKGIELFQECRPPLILVHGPEVTPESTATASRENVARVMAQLATECGQTQSDRWIGGLRASQAPHTGKSAYGGELNSYDRFAPVAVEFLGR